MSVTFGSLGPPRSSLGVRMGLTVCQRFAKGSRKGCRVRVSAFGVLLETPTESLCVVWSILTPPTSSRASGGARVSPSLLGDFGSKPLEVEKTTTPKIVARSEIETVYPPPEWASNETLSNPPQIVSNAVRNGRFARDARVVEIGDFRFLAHGARR